MTTQKFTPPNTEITPSRHTPEMMQRALRHAFHRDHGHMEFCDACVESKALLTLAAESFGDMLSALKAAVADRIDDEWLKNARQIIRKAEKQP